jgi:PEP-CTERM motif
MYRLLRLSCASLLLTSLFCFADSVTTLKTLNVSLTIRPNDGLGDNLGGTIWGGGVSLTVGGGTPVDWFSATDGIAPGSGVGGSTTIFFDDVFGTIGKTTYDDSNLLINAADFNAGGATLPTDGSAFTMSVPASIGLIVLTGCNTQGCTTFNVITQTGVLTMSYFFFDGLYYADSASFVSTATVPEPSTLSLLAIGLAALRWRTKAVARR